MKQTLLTLTAVLMLSPAFANQIHSDNREPQDRQNNDADRPRSRENCDCAELNRRAEGLRWASENCDPRQRRNVEQQADEASQVYQQALRSDNRSQSQICSRENERVNALWVQWQPIVARNGADIGNRCE